MTRNGKIALGCGGAGCLGLILIVVLGVVLVVSGVVPAPGLYDANRNSNYNSNDNYNGSYNSNSNDNTNSSSDSGSSDSSSMSEDDRHKLYQAAASTQDQDLIRQVSEKLGLLDANGSANDEYGPFIRAHISWLFKNTDFVQSINTPEKARAYVDEHIND